MTTTILLITAIVLQLVALAAAGWLVWELRAADVREEQLRRARRRNRSDDDAEALMRAVTSRDGGGQ
ncbi:hypothetical protein [Haloactinospora alba]|uniref:hypothetical protein n=1 Tax=Haloactinospora alba TaxID=405555 RepID=UPI0011501A0A|nr:hypothetical protein [Haloactinospora alba]